MRPVRLGVAVTGAVLAAALTPNSAGALNIGISAGTPATFGTTLSPGQTVTSTGGTITITSLLGLTGWTLTVKDATGGGTPGRLRSAGGVGCTGSTTALANPVQIYTPNPGYSSLSVAARHAVTASDTTVATYTPLVTLLSSVTLTTEFQQTVGAAEILRAGCVYSTTVTYTVQ
jgi:hypothetical protein